MPGPAMPWVAGSVRARLLARRAVGPRVAESVASSGSLDGALRVLGATPYGREVRPGMDLAGAERGVGATLLWHLRVLAGWLPRGGAEAVRVLAGWFEIANLEDRLAVLAGAPARPPFALGALATAWRRAATAPTAEAVRAALAASAWGDPGSADPAALHLALRLAWADRLRRRVPEAGHWAEWAAVLLVARELAAGRRVMSTHLGPPAARRLGGAESLDAAAGRLPRSDRWMLDGVAGLDDLWAVEERWWGTLQSGAAAMLTRERHGRAVVVGAAALLAADARLLRGALAVAAGGGEPRGIGDAVA